jgi:hypothetical protein
MSGRSTCPECGTVLRIRDRSFVGRKVNCPECKTPLRIEFADRDDKFVFQRLSTADIGVVDRKSRSQRPKSSPSIPSNVTARSFFPRAINSPLMAISLVVVAVFVLIAVITMNARLRFSSGSSIAVRKVAESLGDVVEKPAPPAIEPVSISANPEPVVESSDAVATEAVISALQPENADEPLSWSPFVADFDPAESPATTPETPVPTPVKVDVKARMEQRILLYKQPKVSRRLLLIHLQEQLNVKIRYNVDELGAASLEDKVAFEKERTTLGEILKLVVDEAGWQIIIEDDGIRLTKKSEVL